MKSIDILKLKRNLATILVSFVQIKVELFFTEIPYMAAHEFDARRRMISKSYYQQLRSSERQALVGPPESMREHVVAASKAMRNGDWEKCRDFIINPKMNAKVWDLFYEADKVRAMLARKIQEETLRTYLFTYSKVYNSISIVRFYYFITGCPKKFWNVKLANFIL